MSRKPDGKPAKTERVTFTRPAAERIAKVVREVEAGDRDQAGLTFGNRVGGVSAKTFRVCTFTGAWSIGSAKTVTFRNQTTTPNTVSATNLFFPVTSTATATKDCAVAKDGTAWYLIDVPLATATAVFVTGTQTRTFASGTATATVISGTTTGISASGTTTQNVITDIAITASLNTTDCTITIGKTLTTASMTFVTGTANSVFVTGTATAMVVSQTATSVFVTGTVTATYLTFG